MAAEPTAVGSYVATCSPVPGGGGSLAGAPGTGFFRIPGTNTCLHVGGRVRAEFRYLEPATRGGDATGFRGRGLIGLDARTATEYGTLRAFVRYELTRDTGNYLGASGAAATVPAFAPFGPFLTPGGSASADIIRMDRAFIQFGGLTAGRTTSFFDSFVVPHWGGYVAVGDTSLTGGATVFAYTHSFGNGFSGTISAEDVTLRRAQGRPTFGLGGPGTPTGIVYAGLELPDLVANLRYEGGLGQVQVSAAAHPITALNTASSDTEWGFAVQAGGKLNLPSLGAGDALFLNAAYSEGALHYTGLAQTLASGQNQASPINFGLSDAIVDPAGRLQLTRAFSVYGAFLHYWTPQLRQLLFGSFGRIDYAVESPNVANLGAAPTNGAVDTNYWQVGSQLVVTPVRGLDIGVELLYRSVDPKRPIVDPTGPRPDSGVVRLINRDDALEARIRVQRDF